MKWNKFRLKTTTAAEDIVSSILSDLGIEGVEIEDKVPLTQKEKEQMFVDILPETIPDDGTAFYQFLSGRRGRIRTLFLPRFWRNLPGCGNLWIWVHVLLRNPRLRT